MLGRMVGWGVRVVVVAGRWMELGKNKIVQYLQSVKTISLFLIHIAVSEDSKSLPDSHCCMHCASLGPRLSLY